MPFPPTDGGAQVMHFTTKGLLGNGIDVKVLAINPTRNFVNHDLLPTTYVAESKFESVIVDTRIKPLNLIINLFRRESYFIERFISLDFENKLRQLLKSEQFDIIQLEHLYLCIYIRTIKEFSKAKVILRPQNVEYVIWERYKSNVRDIFKKIILNIATKRLKKFEQGAFADIDGVIALTKQDAELFQLFSPETPMIVVPMGYDYDRLSNYDFEMQFNNNPVVYHLGSMDWLPNVEAVDWFVNKVIPCLLQLQFRNKIIIAGRNMPSRIFQLQSDILEVIDEVDNPLIWQSDKQIMIVPLWSGSGIRAKIIEGLALGKTIISTSIGAQGIDFIDGVHLLIADTPLEFAKMIVKCVNSEELCRYISRNARELSEQKYHCQYNASEMVNFYHKLKGSDE